MNEQSRLQQLAARAQLETPPRVDVADRVMAILRAEGRERTAEDRTLVWVAALSAAAAVPAALAAFLTWEAWTDPLAEVFVELPWEMLI